MVKINPGPRFKIPGAPDLELLRSPAAARVGDLAARSGLLMTHFEYRTPLPTPPEWLPLDRDDLGEKPEWQGGVLPESKYRSFRTDLMIGSFHPGHRAKWTAHELCHGLVGFGWKAGASLFFHALAARMAELLPVALFYFFDEAFLNRCPLHQDLGPLFGVFCPDCEEAALQGPRTFDPHAERMIRDGKTFIERELRAVARSLQLGKPIASPWGNLDLSSDGLAYASMQYKRLSSPEFCQFMELFFPPGTGSHPSLEALEQRILSLSAALTGEGQAEPWPVAQETWKARDLAWRLFEIRTLVAGEPERVINQLIQQLATNPNQETIQQTIDTWQELYQGYEVPESETLFSVGYPLARGYGYSQTQIGEGLASACPLTWERLGEQGKTVASAFMAADRPQRRLLGLRFADWAQDQLDPINAELAAFEAAVAHLPARDPATVSLASLDETGPWQLSPGVQLIPTSHQVMEILEMPVPEDERELQPYLLLCRDNQGEIQLIHLEPEPAEWLCALQKNETPDWVPYDVEALITRGIVVPKRWKL